MNPDLKDFVDVVSKTTTTIATVMAGGWAYYRFVKGRVFTPRLTIDMSSYRLRVDKANYVFVELTVSNVGLSKIEIKSANLRISKLSDVANAETNLSSSQEWLKTVPALLAHSWIESGEILKEEIIIALEAPPSDCPLVVYFRVVVKGISFTATSIAQSKPDGTSNKACLSG
jgi:hypothetical protein